MWFRISPASWFETTPRKLRLERQAGGIVDDLGAVLQGAFSDLRLVGIHGDRDGQGVAQALQHRNEAPQFLRGRDARRFRPGGLRPDVDDVGALLLHLQRAREGPIRILILAAIGEGVRRHIQHAKNGRALAQFDLAGFEFPVEQLSHAKNAAAR